MDKWNKPQQIDDVSLAFPASVKDLMPAYTEIPAESRRQSNPWVKWQQEWFFSGLKRYPVPKEGIDRKAAMRHLNTIQGSFEPKHEHKEAAVAYLASLWFTSPDGEEIKKAV